MYETWYGFTTFEAGNDGCMNTLQENNKVIDLEAHTHRYLLSYRNYKYSVYKYTKIFFGWTVVALTT